MLYIPMYHRASEQKRGNSRETLKRHFEYYAENFCSVLPTDELCDNKQNVCITFDDGYKDFGEIVLPLLKEFELKAILSISPKLIDDDKDGKYMGWSELHEARSYKNLEIAVQGLTHTVIADREHAKYEAQEAKKIIEDKLAYTPRSFVYPYGKFTIEAHKEIKKEYEFVFRIGGAVNVGWGQNMFYRFSADNIDEPSSMFTKLKKVTLLAKMYINLHRGL
ncbi:MAG: polysaccharide deacetylase family protein [Campylobacterales bacterium]